MSYNKTVVAYYTAGRAAEKLFELMLTRRTPAMRIFGMNNNYETHKDKSWAIRAVCVGQKVLMDALEMPDRKYPSGNLHYITNAIGRAVVTEERAVYSVGKTRSNPYSNFVSGPGKFPTQSWHRIIPSKAGTINHSHFYGSDKEVNAVGAFVLHAIVSTCPNEFEIGYDYARKNKRRGWVRWIGPLLAPKITKTTPLLREPPEEYDVNHPPREVVRNHWRMRSDFQPYLRRNTGAINRLGQQKRKYYINTDVVRHMIARHSEVIPPHIPKPPKGSPKKQWQKYFSQRQLRDNLVIQGFRINRLRKIEGCGGYQEFSLDYRGRMYVDHSVNYQANKLYRAAAMSVDSYDHDAKEFSEYTRLKTGFSLTEILAMSDKDIAYLSDGEDWFESSVFMAAVRSDWNRVPIFYDYKCSAFQIVAALTNDHNLAWDSGLTGVVDTGTDLYTKVGNLTGLSRDGAKELLTMLMYGAQRLRLLRIIRDDLHCSHGAAASYLDVVIERLYSAYPGIASVMEWREELSTPAGENYSININDNSVPFSYRRRMRKECRLLTVPGRTYKAYRDADTSHMPDRRKNGRALLPNLIHSIDAYIMANCIDTTTQWPIHDCLGGDAGDAKLMRDSVRDILPTIVDGLDVQKNHKKVPGPAPVSRILITPDEISQGTILTLST